MHYDANLTVLRLCLQTGEINVADLGQFGVVHTKKIIKNVCYTS